MQTAEEILDIVNARLDSMYASALELRNDLVNEGVQAKKRGKKENRGTLLIIIRRRETGTFNIAWQRKRWVKRRKLVRGRGQWILYSDYIKRGRSDSYPLRRLLAGAREWEREIVPYIEKRFAAMRKEQRFLMEQRRVARRQLRRGHEDEGTMRDPLPGGELGMRRAIDRL